MRPLGRLVILERRAIVDRSTTETYPVDWLETGWTEPHVGGLERTIETKTITLPRRGSSGGVWWSHCVSIRDGYLARKKALRWQGWTPAPHHSSPTMGQPTGPG
jgi:hypothetical protein